MTKQEAKPEDKTSGFCFQKLFKLWRNIMELDFTKKNLLTESWMRTLADWNKTFLKYLYDNDVTLTADLKESEDEKQSLKFVIRGEVQDVQAYAKAIMAEKHYLDFYIKNGPEHPQSQKSKELLDQAVAHFEEVTGITWPFKDEE